MHPTLVPIEKARSIFRAAKPKKDKALMLSGDVQLTRNMDDDVLVSAVYEHYVGLRILGNASAMAGNFLAHDLEGTAEIVFATLDANLDYADQAMRRALAWSVNPTAAVVWLCEKDLDTWSHMLLLMRRGHTQGVALARAMDTMRVDWSTVPTVASRAAPPVSVFSGQGGGRAPRSPRRQRQRIPGATPKSAASRPKTTKRRSPRRSSPESRRVQSVTQIKGGMHTCKLFNDERGCTGDEMDCP